MGMTTLFAQCLRDLYSPALTLGLLGTVNFESAARLIHRALMSGYQNSGRDIDIRRYEKRPMVSRRPQVTPFRSRMYRVRQCVQ